MSLIREVLCLFQIISILKVGIHQKKKTHTVHSWHMTINRNTRLFPPLHKADILGGRATAGLWELPLPFEVRSLHPLLQTPAPVNLSLIFILYNCHHQNCFQTKLGDISKLFNTDPRVLEPQKFNPEAYLSCVPLPPLHSTCLGDC